MKSRLPVPLSLLLAAALMLAACQTSSEADEVPAPEGRGQREQPAEEPAVSPADPVPATIVLATVNGRDLTLEDAMDAFLSSHTGHGVLVRGEPAVRELAGRLVERDLFLAEAATLGVPEDPLVDEVVADYAIRTAEIAYWKREVDDKVEVSEEEVEAFYSKTDVALSLAIIETETREEAEALRARVVAGEDMEELALAQSIHESRTFGGALSFMRRGELEVALEDVAFALAEPDELTEVVATEDGYAFLRLVQRSENPDRPPREEALPQIRMILEGRLEDDLRARVEADVAESVEIEIDDSLLTVESLLGEDQPEAVVASVAEATLTLGDLRAMLNLEALSAVPETEANAALAGIVDEWAQVRATRETVARSGLLEDPEVVEKAESFRKDVILKMLYGRYVYADVDPGEDEVRAYYDQHLEDEFTRPPEYRLAYIVLETEEEAGEVLERANAGEDFRELARERSIDPTAIHGGRIGWARPGTLLPEVEEAAFALEVGGVAGPVATTSGYFVVKLLDQKPAEPLPFETSRGTALERLTIERQREAYAKWALALRERADADIRDEGVAQAVAWLEEQALEAEAAAAEAAQAEAAGGDEVGSMATVAPPGHGAAGELP